MRNTFPPVLFRAIAWAGSAAFIAVAVVRWRLDDIYHTTLALVVTAHGKRNWLTLFATDFYSRSETFWEQSAA